MLTSSNLVGDFQCLVETIAASRKGAVAATGELVNAELC